MSQIHGYSKQGWKVAPKGSGSTGYGGGGSTANIISNFMKPIIPLYDAITFMVGTTIYTEDRNGTTLSPPSTNMYAHATAGINYCDNRGGGLYYIDASSTTYNGNSTTVSLIGIDNVTIRGAGWGATRLKDISFQKSKDSTPTNKCAFEYFSIDANNTMDYCIDLRKFCVDFVLRGMELKNTKDKFCLDWSAMENGLVEACIFKDAGLNTAADNAAGGQNSAADTRTVFRDCYFNKTNSLGSAMLTTGGTGDVLFTGCDFVNNMTENPPTSHDPYAAISIENFFGAAKTIEITDCFSLRCGKTAAAFTIGNSDQSTNIIQRAIIKGCKSIGPGGGFNIRGTLEAICSDCIAKDVSAGFTFMDIDSLITSNTKAINTNIFGSGTVFDKGGMYCSNVKQHLMTNYTCYDTQGGSNTTPYGMHSVQSSAGVNSLYISNMTLIGPFTLAGPIFEFKAPDHLNVTWNGGSISNLGFTTSGTTGLRRFTNVVGINNLGTITNPFAAGDNSIAVFGGSAATPSQNTDYAVKFTDTLITVTGGTGVALTLKDPAGTTIVSGLATLTNMPLPNGYKLRASWTTAPTFVVCGV